jgi:hypothetical protein
MDAREIVKALGGRWHGGYGMVRCVSHQDATPSLKITEGRDGPLAHCFAGCAWRDVRDALRGRGLLPRGPDKPPATRKREREPRNGEAALDIWRTCGPIEGTVAEAYLRGRGIALSIPPTLRHHSALKHGPTGLDFPALVAAVQAPTGKVAAVHRTYLLPDGRGKAPVNSPKMALGPIGAGAVRLGPAKAAMALAEGIETGLSAMQLFDIPVWAALGSRLDRVELPGWVIEVQIFGDNGEPGHKAAQGAAEALTAQGRRVAIRYPPEQFGDWNAAVQAMEGATWIA